MPLPITFEVPSPRRPRAERGGMVRRLLAAISPDRRGLGVAMRPVFAGLPMLAGLALWGQATPTYQIQSAVPAIVAAGTNGASIALSGNLPNFTQGTYQVCFYTGSGSNAALTPALVQGAATVTVPASTIQAIPAASFTSANGYAVPASIYVVPSGNVCNGTSDPTLTNSFTVPVVEPTLGVYLGPTDIPQTNSATNVAAPPTSITLAGNNFVAATTVSFGTFGSVTPKLLTASSISVAVPAAFSSSQAGTTAALTVCNSVAGGTSFCSTPATPITLTVTALSPSAGSVTASPTPVTTSGQTILTAQFAQASGQPGPAGAPSGTVTFTVPGTAVPAAKLILDKTAVFTAQTSVVSTSTTATPTITPVAGSYLNSATITIADATPGAIIYYTQDGTVPTIASTVYTGPFSITTSQTITALAAASGYLNSAAVSAAYVITVNPPTQLAFLVQPSNTGTGAPITPAAQVAIEDVNGNTVTSSTSAVTMALSSNPGDSTLMGTTTVNGVNGIATFSNLSIAAIANGYTLIATSGTLTPATSAAFNITPTPITMTVQSALIGIGSTLTGSFTLGQPAPAPNGVVVTLASSAPANATIAPATVTVAAGQTTGAFTYTGVAAGNANLTASAPNYLTGTVQVTGTAAQVSLGMIPAVAPGQMMSLALSLPSPPPPGGTTVTFTSSATNVATVTASVFVPAGQQTPAANPQVTGVTIGTSTITAFAPGFAPATRTATVTVVATFNPTNTTINLTTSTNTTLNISAPAPPGGITFTLSSDNPAVATVPASVTVAQGGTSVGIPITGVAAGSTTIRADSAGITEATLSLNVVSAISVGAVTTGVSLENYTYISLPVAPQVPITVTVTSTGAAIATLSKTGTVVGGTTLTFTNVTSSGVGYVYVQGQSAGTANLTVTATGYTTGTGTITVQPSGFAFNGIPSFSTTAYSGPTGVTVYPSILTPGTLTVAQLNVPLNPGLAPINVPVTSSNTAVGTITTSPIVFHAGDSGDSTTFQPIAAGTSNISIGTPAGFSTPSQYQQITATVTTPAITVGNTTTGVNLESYTYVSLPVAPPTGVTVTVTSSGPAIATISNTGTVVGGTTLTFTNVTSSGVGYVYIQGQTAGTTTLTVSAPGYTSGSGTVSVLPSGFTLYYDSSFSTTTLSSPTTVTVYTASLNPGALTVNQVNLPLNPGLAPINVPVTSSSTAVGAITTSPVVFHAGDSNDATTFQPMAAGMSNITLGTPAGYSTPTQSQQITATVTAAPTIIVGSATTGVNLETYTYVSLPVTPPTPVTVTVTSSGPAIATISSSGTVVGGTTLTFTNVTSSGVGYVYIQGQSTGTATLTVSAPGYTSGSGTITVQPSGFIYYYSSSFSTTTFSTPTSVTASTAILTPGTLTVSSLGGSLNPGLAQVKVPIASSNLTVGTLAASSIVFNPGDSNDSTTFQPVAAGMSNITLGTPAGFSTPSQYQQITATVTAPAITVNNTTTGAILETPLSIYLPVAPPNAVTVTVASNGPAIATLSNSATAVGGSTLTFTNVTSTFVGTIYVQGQTVGTTTMTVSAPGYTNGIANITVYPSGFAFNGDASFTTTTSQAPTTLTLYPFALTPGTLTILSFGLQVNPGVGPISIPITSSDLAVGTITTSPIIFNAGDSGDSTTFQPVGVGTSTISIGTPAGFSTPSQYQQITATVQSP
jgi:trimeric autotransporter adhesin